MNIDIISTIVTALALTVGLIGWLIITVPIIRDEPSPERTMRLIVWGGIAVVWLATFVLAGIEATT